MGGEGPVARGKKGQVARGKKGQDGGGGEERTEEDPTELVRR